MVRRTTGRWRLLMTAFLILTVVVTASPPQASAAPTPDHVAPASGEPAAPPARAETSPADVALGAPQIFGTGLHNPGAMVLGPDGNVWVSRAEPDGITRVSPDGSTSATFLLKYAAPSDFAVGPDGAIWFTVPSSSEGLGRITMEGEITRYPNTGLNNPRALTAGSDGALWFANTKTIGRMGTDGAFTFFGLDAGIGFVEGIAGGSDGAVWFTDSRRTASAGSRRPVRSRSSSRT